MPRFKAGERVEVIKNNAMSVNIGDQAIVESCGERLVNVVWDRKGLNRYGEPFSQMDGGYDPSGFKKVNSTP